MHPHPFMTQQIMLTRHSQKINQDHAMAGSEAKNPLPATIPGINTMDLLGLSWIFAEETFSKEFIAGDK